MSTRREVDTLGEVEVPEDAYWGAQTERARHNFAISGLLPDPVLIRAYAEQKRASAIANRSLGLLEDSITDAVIQAAEEVAGGELRDQFVVDPFQAGAGTSFHMNVNEVLANRANEILGGPRGSYRPVHPNDHVNSGQSTNDTFPTAIRVALLLLGRELDEELHGLEAALGDKARELKAVVTAGRTHLQDALPVTLGQVFGGHADSLARVRGDWMAAAASLRELGLGGTAVGTGVNRSPEYPQAAVAELGRATALPLRVTDTPIALHAGTGDFARYAASLKGIALELGRLANDLRLMGSGPTSGIGEIELPAVQPGSSIMPGKVNPVMAESLNMVCFHVVGAEAAVAAASGAGQFQINVMTPLIAYELLFSLRLLTRGVHVFRERCVRGIRAHREAARRFAERTVALGAVLSPRIGYARAAKVVEESVRRGVPIAEVAARELGISEEEARRLLDPARWTRPGILDPDDLRS